MILSCIQAILLYDGCNVPLRDIQRKRLYQMPARIIRNVMMRLSDQKLGQFGKLINGIQVFYKCPPLSIDQELLTSYAVAFDLYEQHYHTLPQTTPTNKHTETYWQKIEQSSPYGIVAVSGADNFNVGGVQDAVLAKHLDAQLQLNIDQQTD